MVPINYLAVVLAAVASMVVGSLWYGPLFGKEWMKLMGINKGDMRNMKGEDMAKLYGVQFLGSLVMSCVLAHAIVFASAYLKTEGLVRGLMVGFWSWLGFVVPVTIGSILWEKKPVKLWLINAGNYLVTLLVMGAILGLWR